MELLGVSFLAGVLTILAPCVLPLLPIIIGGSVAKENKSRPYLIALSLVVSLVAFTLLLKASTALLSVPPQFWQYISGGLIIIFGLVSLFPGIWDTINVKLNLSGRSDGLLHKAAQKNNAIGSILIGLSLGPVFSSCSPTYGLLLAVVLPENFGVGLLNIVVYSAGLALMLMLISIFGQKMIRKVKWAADPKGWFKRGLGVLFILVGLMIFTGYEKKVETWLLDQGFYDAIADIETNLISDDTLSDIVPLGGNASSYNETTNTDVNTTAGGPELKITNPYPAPQLAGLTNWINSNELTLEGLKGKVVIIDFWTYSCINCIRTLPFLQDWHEKYEDDGLVIIGVHAPEFAFERIPANVQGAVDEYGLGYPVVLDNDFTTWRNYSNRYWPAKYFIDREGNVRHTHFGEGEYVESEEIIQFLLSENGVAVDEEVLEEEPNSFVSQGQSPETYLGYERGAGLNVVNQNEFASTEIGSNESANFSAQELTLPNEWSLGGEWSIQDEKSVTESNNTVLRYNFSAKEVYLVLGSVEEGANPEVEVWLNGAPIADINKGEHVNEAGVVIVEEHDLYRLVNLPEFATEQVLELRFDAGIEAHAFTFGS